MARTTIEQLFPELTRVIDADILPVANICPEAVVLVTLHVTCQCGHEYESPNPGLLLRWGQNMTKVDIWKSNFNLVPRERVTHHIKAHACEECFDESSWCYADFIQK